MSVFDSIIIGAGPAGLFSAYRLLNRIPNAKVLLIDKGFEANNRQCSRSCVNCKNIKRCSVLCGVGGAGLFSDGKLVLDLRSGGMLDSVSNISDENKIRLTNYIEKTLRGFDGISYYGPTPSDNDIKKWSSEFKRSNLNIKHYKVLHMGSQNLKHIISNFVKLLKSFTNFTLLTNLNVTNVYKKSDDINVVETDDNKTFLSSNIIFSVGKTGSKWLRDLFEKNNISFKKTPAYIGVRLETSHENIAKLFEFSFDPKIWMESNNRKVKTHCFCRHGEVINTNYMGYSVVGGHTQLTENEPDKFRNLPNKSNFNILISTSSDQGQILSLLEKFKTVNPYGYVVQTVGSFFAGNLDSDIKNLKKGQPGNIRSILDSFDESGKYIAEFIQKLGEIVPGIMNVDNLIYAPAIEWLMDMVNVDSNMETQIKGWFAVGDGAGLSQGVVHAAATGIIAAEEICNRIKNVET